MSNLYERPYLGVVTSRLSEERRFVQVVAGPRQIGKTTMVRQALNAIPFEWHYATADGPALRDASWIEQQWEVARSMASASGQAVLALDEVQKVPGWSESVKRLWDEDAFAGLDLRVAILGSAPLLVQRGLTESLTGRFEMIRLPHWSFREMSEAFGWDIDRYIYFGGYPGSASLIDDEDRWTNYVRESIIETTISRDVLLMSRVDKPALLRRLFELACVFSGQILSYNKMLGQLQDAGNTVTLAHYVELLAGAGMVTGLQKFAGGLLRRRSSSPKLQVFNNALLTAQSRRSFAESRADPAWWGRLTESAVGAHLANAQLRRTAEVFYWREGNREVDFVVTAGRDVAAIEVKSGRREVSLPGMREFRSKHPAKLLLVGADGIPVEEFLSTPAEEWVRTPRA